MEGGRIQTKKIKDGDGRSSDRKGEKKVLNEKIKVANGGIVKTVTDIATKVKLDKEVRENVLLQTQLRRDHLSFIGYFHNRKELFLQQDISSYISFSRPSSYSDQT